jgi:hypothetical protein
VRRALTNVAPDRCPVNGVVGPNHGIDELVEARQSDPHHVVASSGIPRLEVPWQRDEDSYKTKGGDDGEERISDVEHDSGWAGREGGGDGGKVE